MQSELPSEALHPYTVSERIRVLSELLAGSRGKLPDQLTCRLARRVWTDAELLYQRPETGLGVHNHLVNNARALCAAGWLWEGEPAADRWLSAARALWDETWPHLVLDDGVFTEQSTHYHVLLTRTLLEYIRDARLGSRKLPSGMLERAAAMCRVTDVLVRTDGTIPLFGDVSPDLPTSWLRGMPLACVGAGLLQRPRDSFPGYAAGASALFPEPSAGNPADSPAEVRACGPRSQVELFRSGGILWVRDNLAGAELIAHGDPRPESRCHGDVGRGSFEIWYRGVQVVIDGGMPTYEAGAERNYFRGPDGQNAVALDRLAPSLLTDEIPDLPRWYVGALGGGSWILGPSSATFEWRGFERHRPGLVWRRIWAWNEDEYTITDRIHGPPDEVTVVANLHLAGQSWRPAGSSYRGRIATVRYEGPPVLRHALIAAPVSPEYGVTRQGHAIRLQGQARPPFEWRWTVSLLIQD